MVMETMQKIKILLVAAVPPAERGEAALLKQKLTAEPCGRCFEVVALRAVKVDNVIEAVKNLRPDIVHFCGECTAKGDFVFADDDGTTSDWCSKSSLLKKMAQAVDEIRLVYFNGAVKDSELATAQGKIAVLIGMQQRGETVISKKFVVPFYMALGFGNPVGFAFAKVWQVLPEGERKLVLRFRNDIDPDKYCLRSSGAPMPQAAALN